MSQGRPCSAVRLGDPSLLARPWKHRSRDADGGRGTSHGPRSATRCATRANGDAQVDCSREPEEALRQAEAALKQPRHTIVVRVHPHVVERFRSQIDRSSFQQMLMSMPHIVSVTCEAAKLCSRALLYTIRRGQSVLTFSQPTGFVVEEKVDWGYPGVIGAALGAEDQRVHARSSR